MQELKSKAAAADEREFNVSCLDDGSYPAVAASVKT